MSTCFNTNVLVILMLAVCLFLENFRYRINSFNSLCETRIGCSKAAWYCSLFGCHLALYYTKYVRTSTCRVESSRATRGHALALVVVAASLY